MKGMTLYCTRGQTVGPTLWGNLFACFKFYYRNIICYIPFTYYVIAFVIVCFVYLTMVIFSQPYYMALYTYALFGSVNLFMEKCGQYVSLRLHLVHFQTGAVQGVHPKAGPCASSRGPRG